MPITLSEKAGIIDLLLTEEQNVPTLLQLAKSVTKNICDISDPQEAFDYIYTHIGDTLTLLNKRAITKEILFRYLHHKKVPVNADFSKGALISKVCNYWNSQFPATNTATKNESYSPSAQWNVAMAYSSQPQIEEVRTAGSFAPQPVPTYAVQTSAPDQYPIHLLARQFAEWFFEHYNDNSLKVEDFWGDVQLQLRIAASDQITNCECSDAEQVIEALMRSKLQFEFFFNPNLTHAGAQGRMNAHGLVLVLACGTLHTHQNCVGVFECVFGLLRDPFAENNWKVKTIQCTLRSQATTAPPTLYESDTLRESLSLPVPADELT